MTEKDVYLFYNEKVKILYSEIEARSNTLPVELLFEIHSAFDHLKRIHVDNEPETSCAEKAFSYSSRIFSIFASSSAQRGGCARADRFSFN